MKLFSRLLAFLTPALLFFISLSLPVRAVYFETGNNLNLTKEKKIDETAFISGSTIIVDSNINGDLLCAGQDITVNGNIKGDVLCAGQSIKVNGTVDGDVRVAAQTIEISGLVNHNVYALSQNLTLTKFSSVKGDIFYGVQNVDLRGSLGRDMLGAAEQINITGSLLRNAKVTGSSIFITDPAKIGGDFEYYIDRVGTASVSPSNVKGSITRHEIMKEEVVKKTEVATKSFNVIAKVFSLLSYFVLGLAIIYFLKRGVEDRTGFIQKKPLVSGLVGFAVLIMTPIAFVILLSTIIGIPFAFVLLLEYILSLITASIYPTIVLGKWLMHVLFKNKNPKPVLSLIVGLLGMTLVLSLPVVGIMLGLVVLCLGLGSIFLSYLPQ